MARVALSGPDGNYSVEEAELPQALAAGYKLAEPVSKADAIIRGAKQGLTAGLGSKAGAALDATAASINQLAREHAPALVPDEPTITETRTGGAGGDLSWAQRYENAKRVNQAVDLAAESAQPTAYGVSKAVGGLIPASRLLGAAKGASLIGRSALLSGLEGAGESHGDTVGDVVGDAAIRASLGALASLPVAALSKIPALRDWLRQRAGIEAFKQAAGGGAKSAANAVGGLERAQEVGQEILDRGILKAGDQPAEILKAAQAAKGAAGEAIGQAVRGSGATVNLPDVIGKLESGALAEAKASGSGYAPIAARLQGVVDDLKAMQSEFGDVVPAGLVHEYKIKQANLINWLSDKARAEAEQRAVGTISGAVKQGVAQAGAGPALESANRGFGLMADLEKVAEKGATGEANRVLGMSETLGSGFGGTVAATLGHALGGGPGALGAGTLGSLAGGAGAHYWRLHGSGVSARALNVGAQSLEAVSAKLAANPQLAHYAELLQRTAAAAGPAAAASMHFLLYEKDPAYRQSVSGAE